MSMLIHAHLPVKCGKIYLWAVFLLCNALREAWLPGWWFYTQLTQDTMPPLGAVMLLCSSLPLPCLSMSMLRSCLVPARASWEPGQVTCPGVHRLRADSTRIRITQQFLFHTQRFAVTMAFAFYWSFWTNFPLWPGMGTPRYLKPKLAWTDMMCLMSLRGCLTNTQQQTFPLRAKQNTILEIIYKL